MARIGVVSGVVIAGLWLLLGNIRKGLVRWRPAIRVAIPAALLTAVAPLLSMDLLLENYDSAVPLQTFEGLVYLLLGMSLIVAFLMFVAMAALIASFYPESLSALRRANRRRMGLDAGVALLMAAGLAMLSGRLGTLLVDRFHAQALVSVGTQSLGASAEPALAAVAESVRALFSNAAILAVIALIWRRLPRHWMRLPLVLLAVFAVLPAEIRTPGEFALQYAVALIPIGCAAWFCLRFARQNYLAYALALGLVALGPPAGRAIRQRQPGAAHARMDRGGRIWGCADLGAAAGAEGPLRRTAGGLRRPSRRSGAGAGRGNCRGTRRAGFVARILGERPRMVVEGLN